MNKVLLSLGHGYSARALTPLLLAEGWQIIGTTRSAEKCAALADMGVDPLLWEKSGLEAALGRATHVLMSAAPDAEGDPALRLIGEALTARAPALDWVGYLSTTGVYGDSNGAWVDETTPLTGSTRRGQARIKAEAAWGAIPGLPLHIFRLAGIYGPGRGPFEKIRNGTARRVIKPGQVFSRIHVRDIAATLKASIDRPAPGTAYNVCDGDPAPPQDVLAYAAELLEMPPPPEVDFDTAEMSPMARSFYAESKRVSNTRLIDELGVRLAYPDYRTGLKAMLAEEQGA